jgi:hypothetical protein
LPADKRFGSPMRDIRRSARQMLLLATLRLGTRKARSSIAHSPGHADELVRPDALAECQGGALPGAVTSTG